MMIQWFEDKLLTSIPPTEESLARLSRYAKIYAENGAVAASLACVLCRLVVECRVKGSSVYGALQDYTGENKIYYLPNLPMPSLDYQDLTTFLGASSENHILRALGHDLCAIFTLAKRLGVNPDHLLFVTIVAAELLMSRTEEEVQVPIEIDMDQVEAMFSL